MKPSAILLPGILFVSPSRPEKSVSKLGPVVQIEEGKIEAYPDEVFRNTVEALNALLE
jgi:hypothetical protein